MDITMCNSLPVPVSVDKAVVIVCHTPTLVYVAVANNVEWETVEGGPIVLPKLITCELHVSINSTNFPMFDISKDMGANEYPM